MGPRYPRSLPSATDVSRPVQQPGLDERIFSTESRDLEQSLAQGVSVENLNFPFPSVLHFFCVKKSWKDTLPAFILVTSNTEHPSMPRPRHSQDNPTIEILCKHLMSVANCYHQRISSCNQTPRAPRIPETMILALTLATRLSFVLPPVTLLQDQSPNPPPFQTHIAHCGGRLHSPQRTTLHLELADRASSTIRLASNAKRTESEIHLPLVAFECWKRYLECLWSESQEAQARHAGWLQGFLRYYVAIGASLSVAGDTFGCPNVITS